MIDQSDYEREYAGQYRAGEFEPVIARFRRQRVLASLHAHPHARILEVGCGFEPLFPDVDAFDEYWIVEPNAEAVRRVRESQSAGVHVVEGFLEAGQDALPSAFDFIVASSLLHEVPDPVAFLAAVREHCSDATVVHLNVPNVGSFHRLLALEAGLIDDLFEQSETEKRFQRQTRFDLASLTTMVEENGFRVLASGTYFVKPFTHSQMEQLLRHGIIDMRIVDALDRMTTYMPGLGCEMFVELRLRA